MSWSDGAPDERHSGSHTTDLEWQAAAFRCLMANVPDTFVNHENWMEVGRKRADQTVDWTYNYPVNYGSPVWNCVFMANGLIRVRDAYIGNDPVVAKNIADFAVSESPVLAAQRSEPQNPSIEGARHDD